MCPSAGIGILLGIGATAVGVSAYQQYNIAQDAARTQATLAMQQGQMQYQQYMMQSAFQSMQAAAFMNQSSMLTDQAAAYQQQAQIAKTTGDILQQQQMMRAAQVEEERDRLAQVASTKRRLLIGEGKVKFAANGVLIESRPQSAVAMWEQDEVADLAYELSEIKRSADNEIFGFVSQGYQDKLQSLFTAEGLRLQGEATKIEAYNARINAAGSEMQSAISGANAAMAMIQAQAGVAAANQQADTALWGMVGSLAGLGMQGATMASGMSRNSSPTGQNQGTRSVLVPPGQNTFY